ncbi:CvpA family protein [Litorivicinus lipolyticus]|uniref:CvpA family protein n=1 Tax=Litorivicinus lipolyticus TaxID=418701 RepID=A0A5Q2Q9V2_9GAMM|nr:CvpA family protein [Litorivicinus lipolyticus]QGG79744.1 CvpA family protein [Litorivicinus lipolyticus]
MTLTEFTLLDWAFAALIGVSALMSLAKGLIKEAMSLGIWVAAFFGSRALGPKAEVLFDGLIENPFYITIAGFASVFIAILILGAAVRFALAALVQATGLTWTDRLLGVVFGVARGALIVTLAVGLVNLSPFRSAEWFVKSQLVPQFIEVAEWSVAKLWHGAPLESPVKEN